MSNTLSKIIIFAAGALVGSAVTYKVVETRIKNLMQEELEAVREFYGEPEEKVESDSEDETDKIEEEYPDAPDEYYEKEMTSERSRYRGIMNEEGYSNEEDNDMEKPYVISPEEFGEEGYVQQSLTYYADGIITNERGKIIKNVDELIGINPADHFGEYEDDSVFVRNDNIKVDYEILKDYREFSEIS